VLIASVIGAACPSGVPQRRLSLRRAKKHAFHGRGKLLLVGVMRQQKLQCAMGPAVPARQHCPDHTSFITTHRSQSRGDPSKSHDFKTSKADCVGATRSSMARSKVLETAPMPHTKTIRNILIFEDNEETLTIVSLFVRSSQTPHAIVLASRTCGFSRKSGSFRLPPSPQVRKRVRQQPPSLRAKALRGSSPVVRQERRSQDHCRTASPRRNG